MEVREQLEQQLDPVRSFTVSSLRCEASRWRELVSEEKQQVVLSSFSSSPDYSHLFLWRDSDAGLRVQLTFPLKVQTKVICVSKSSPEALSRDTRDTGDTRDTLIIREVQGENALDFIITVSEEVTCPLLSNPEARSCWAAGVAEEATRFMERQKNEALVMKAQIEGRTFLALPDDLHDDHLHGNAIHDDAEGRKLSDVKLLHACESTIIEWAELVSEFLQQDSSPPVLDGLKPLPSEEFTFWRTRLKNLHFIQQQLLSSRAQQLASIAQRAESVYLSTLRDIYRDVQEGLEEAEDVTVNLNPVQLQLEQLEQLEYQQLGENVAAVMEEVQLMWIRSEFYRKPTRIVVLLQEVCNLFIHTSRKFLRGGEVMRGLVSDPGPVLDDVRLVIWTLQILKEAYAQTRTQLEDQEQRNRDTPSWDFPSHLVFFHMDNFLLHLKRIQEVLCVSLQLSQLDLVVLPGVGGRMWTAVVQEVYQDFLRHVTVLSESTCDPTDPDDQVTVS